MHRYSSPDMRAAGLLLLIVAFAITACEGPTHPSYYGRDGDPFPGGGEPPTLVSVNPDRGFPGDEAVIIGDGFLANGTENMINFGIRVADILSISGNEVTVRVPANESGTQRVRAAVWGAEEWSNELTYTYLEDFVTFDLGIADPRGVAVDDDGNLYISSGSEQAVYRIDGIDSVRTTYATLPVSGPMDFGPGGDLYVTTESGVDRVRADGGVENVVTLAGVRGFDWDEAGDLYILVPNRIHRLRGGTLTEVATVTQAQRIRVFGGHVYVTELTRARVARFQINNDGLGAAEAYFLAGTPISGLDLDENGSVYAGGFVRDYVLKARPDRADDSDIEEIPDETDRANPFRKVTNRLGVIYIHNSVMYLVQDDPAGKVWRIFIDERNAPRHGRS